MADSRLPGGYPEGAVLRPGPQGPLGKGSTKTRFIWEQPFGVVPSGASLRRGRPGLYSETNSKDDEEAQVRRGHMLAQVCPARQ